jgi:hypothetical protein
MMMRHYVAERLTSHEPSKWIAKPKVKRDAARKKLLDALDDGQWHRREIAVVIAKSEGVTFNALIDSLCVATSDCGRWIVIDKGEGVTPLAPAAGFSRGWAG